MSTSEIAEFHQHCCVFSNPTKYDKLSMKLAESYFDDLKKEFNSVDSYALVVSILNLNDSMCDELMLTLSSSILCSLCKCMTINNDQFHALMHCIVQSNQRNHPNAIKNQLTLAFASSLMKVLVVPIALSDKSSGRPLATVLQLMHSHFPHNQLFALHVLSCMPELCNSKHIYSSQSVAATGSAKRHQTKKAMVDAAMAEVKAVLLSESMQTLPTIFDRILIDHCNDCSDTKDTSLLDKILDCTNNWIDFCSKADDDCFPTATAGINAWISSQTIAWILNQVYCELATGKTCSSSMTSYTNIISTICESASMGIEIETNIASAMLPIISRLYEVVVKNTYNRILGGYYSCIDDVTERDDDPLNIVVKLAVVAGMPMIKSVTYNSEDLSHKWIQFMQLVIDGTNLLYVDESCAHYILCQQMSCYILESTVQLWLSLFEVISADQSAFLFYQACIQQLVLSMIKSTCMSTHAEYWVHEQNQLTSTAYRSNIRDQLREIFTLFPSLLPWLIVGATAEVTAYTSGSTDHWCYTEAIVHACSALTRACRAQSVALSGILCYLLHALTHSKIYSCRPISRLSVVIIGELLDAEAKAGDEVLMRQLVLCLCHTEVVLQENPMLTSGVECIGWYLPFRMKQDHIGVVAVSKVIDNKRVIDVYHPRTHASSAMSTMISGKLVALTDTFNQLQAYALPNDFICGNTTTSLYDMLLCVTYRIATGCSVHAYMTWKSFRILLQSMSRACLFSCSAYDYDCNECVAMALHVVYPYVYAALHRLSSESHCSDVVMSFAIHPDTITEDNRQVIEVVGRKLSERHTLLELLQACYELLCGFKWCTEKELMCSMSVVQSIFLPLLKILLSGSSSNRVRPLLVEEVDAMCDIIGAIPMTYISSLHISSNAVVEIVGNILSLVTDLTTTILQQSTAGTVKTKAMSASALIMASICSWRKVVEISFVFQLFYNRVSPIGLQIVESFKHHSSNSHGELSNDSNGLAPLLSLWLESLRATDLIPGIGQISLQLLGVSNLTHIVDTVCSIIINEKQLNSPSMINGASKKHQSLLWRLITTLTTILLGPTCNVPTHIKPVLCFDGLVDLNLNFKCPTASYGDEEYVAFLLSSRSVFAIVRGIVVGITGGGAIPSDIRETFIMALVKVYIILGTAVATTCMDESIMTLLPIYQNGVMSNASNRKKLLVDLEYCSHTGDWKKFKQIVKQTFKHS